MMHQMPEDAFALESQDQIVLRVLAGLQQGAEMPLQPRDFEIGRSEGADIVLSDGSVAPRHLCLRIGREALTVEALEAPVQLGTDWIAAGESAALVLPAVIRLGTTVIGISDAETDWPGIPIPPTAAPPSAAPSEDGEEDADDAEDTAEAGPTEDETPEGTVEPAASEEATAEADAAPSAAPAPAEPAPPALAKARSRRGRWIAIAAVLLLAGGGIGAYLTLGSGRESQTTTTDASAVSPVDAVHAVLTDLGHTSLKVVDELGFGPTIMGYLPTRAEQAAMRTALAEAGLDPVDRTRTGEWMVDAVQTTLGNYRWPEEDFRPHLAVSYHGTGGIEIDGFLGPSVDRDALKRRILGDVPAILTLRFTRSDLRVWREDLRDRIDEAGLSTWLTVTTANGALVVDGELSPGQVATWRTVGEAFVAASGGFPRVQSKVIAAVRAPAPAPAPEPVADAPASPTPEPEPAAEAPQPAPVAPTPPSIRLVGTVIADGGSRWAVLADGRHLRLGDQLHGGGTVTSIEHDAIRIELGTSTYTFRIGERFAVPAKE